MKKLATIAIVVFALAGKAQIGQSFPDVVGETLDKKAATLPIKNKKHSVIGMAFHRSAEDAMKKWMNPLCDAFVNTSKATKHDMDMSHDVNFMFVPFISGFFDIAESYQKSTDKAFWPYVMDTKKTDVKEVAKKLGIKDTKIPYFFVLDETGKVLAVESGDYKADKVSRLEDSLDKEE